MVWEDMRLADILTPQSYDNAIIAHAAMAGSSNALIHLIAMARRGGIDLKLERFDELSRDIPVLANIQPSGAYLMEDFITPAACAPCWRKSHPNSTSPR